MRRIFQFLAGGNSLTRGESATRERLPSRSKFRTLAKLLGWGLAVLVAVPVVVAGTVLIGANTDPGRRLIETQVPRLTGGAVRIEGLTGRFPDAIRIRRVMVADPGGVWLTVNDAELDWSPRHLVDGEVAIDRLLAQSVAVERLPSATSGGGGLPALRGVLSDLRVERLEIGAAVAGQPVTLAVAGAGEILAPDTGEAHLAVTAPRPSDGAPLDHSRDGGPLDHYSVELSMNPARLHAALSVAERPRGLIAGLARLPDLGAIAIGASVDGPISALATKATIAAGQLRASVTGDVDMVARSADLGFSVVAPAMSPGPGIGWSSVQLEGKLKGPLTAPEATAAISAEGLTAAGAGIGFLHANLTGDGTGKTELHASLDGLHVPGPSPDVLAGGPVTLDGTILLAEANRPFRFSLRHKLFSADGTGDAAGGRMRLTLPDLAPLAAIGGADLQGHTALDIALARAPGGIGLTVSGGIGITDGTRPVPALLGDTGEIDLAASLHGEDVTLSRLTLSGAGFNATASGQFVNRVLNLDWILSLNDLDAIRPGLSGTIAAHGHAGGSPASLSVTGDVSGSLAANGEHLDQFSAHITSDGLPNAPEGRLTASGTILGAALDVAIGAERRDGVFHFGIDRVAWKSLTAGGTLDLAEGEALPTGRVTLTMTHLADLAPLLGCPIAGDVRASLDSSPGAARISAVVTGGAVPAVAAVGRAVLDATVTDPSGHAVIDGALTLDGIEASGLHATSRLAAKGPLDGLELTLAATTADLHGMPARLEASGTLNASAETLSLASLRGMWGPEPIRLLAPTRIGFAQGVVVDRLRLGFRQGELAIAGRWRGGPSGARSGTTGGGGDSIRGGNTGVARQPAGGGGSTAQTRKGSAAGSPATTSGAAEGETKGGGVAASAGFTVTLENIPADIVAVIFVAGHRQNLADRRKYAETGLFCQGSWNRCCRPHGQTAGRWTKSRRCSTRRIITRPMSASVTVRPSCRPITGRYNLIGWNVMGCPACSRR